MYKLVGEHVTHRLPITPSRKCPCVRPLCGCRSRSPGGLLRKVCPHSLGHSSIKTLSHMSPCSLWLDPPFAAGVQREHPLSDVTKKILYIYILCRIFILLFGEQYLIKAPEGDAADHHGGVQADAGEEACTLQSHIWATTGWGQHHFSWFTCTVALDVCQHTLHQQKKVQVNRHENLPWRLSLFGNWFQCFY